MINKILLISLITFSSIAFADDLADEFFSKKQVPLNQSTQKALAIARTWGTGSSATKPYRNEKGAVSFLYDGGQTTVVCAVLQVCDITLQKGEYTTGNPERGDPQFEVSPPVFSGEGENKQLHINIKPLDVGLDTTFNVYTNMRSYNFRLISTRHQSMPKVSFIYPEDSEGQWAMKAKPETRKVDAKNSSNISNINFNYTVDGDAEWKPLRVYSDGVKTYIDMPPTISQGNAPALLALKDEGGVFSDDINQLVNYRYQNNKYTVDGVFNKIVLMTGVGGSQTKITITKGGA